MTADTNTLAWIRNRSDELAVENGCRFDAERAAAVCDWIERYCWLYEGQRGPMLLADWQREATLRLFGWVRWSDRLQRWIRRFTRASIWIPKKNGKTPTAAAWALYLLAGDGEPGQKVFFAAADGQQARLAGKHALEMVKASADLSEEFAINLNEMKLTHEPTLSEAKPISSGDNRAAKAKQGLNGCVIIDECFVAGTGVLTPTGTRPIETIRVGDIVYCATGAEVVKGVSCRPTYELFEVEFSNGTKFVCTGNHRVFTGNGWMPARKLEVDAVVYGQQEVRDLWNNVSPKKENANGRDRLGYAGTILDRAEMLLDILLEEVEESNALCRDDCQGESDAKGNSSPPIDSAWQRTYSHAPSIGDVACARGRMGSRTGGPNRNGEKKRFPALLQIGPCEQEQTNRAGVRRQKPPIMDRKKEGCEENEHVGRTRVVRVSRVERQSPCAVFNLHVGGHPSYFANGYLVHNCHVVSREFISQSSIDRAGSTRDEPMHIEVSTAGKDPDSYGKEQYDYGKQVECGDVEDQAFFFLCYEAPQNLTDEALDADPLQWGRMANPTWGRIIQEEEFLADYNRSKRSLADLADFKTFRLNIWQFAASPWLRIDDWRACRVEFTEDELAGMTCYAGLDLSKTRDMTALVLTFPCDDDRYRLLPYFFLPQSAVERLATRFPQMREWVAKGYIIVTPGDVLDYGFLKVKYAELAAKYVILKLIFDPNNAEAVTQQLADEIGTEREAFAQNIMTFNPPTQDFERLVIARQLEHNGHPVMTWQIGHTKVKTDANANKRPVKPKPDDPKKIDGVVAGIQSLAGAIQGGGCWYTPGSMR